MKLGLMTTAFPKLALEKVAEWSSDAGFEAIEVACWPTARGGRRAAAGVCHIDVEALDVAGVQCLLDETGLEISSLAYYPNNLDPDVSQRKAANAHLRKVIDAAGALGVPAVGTLVGRDKTRSLADNLETFRKVWPRLVDYAEGKGVSIAVENCPMIFGAEDWPGGTNLAYAPVVWDEIFSICDSPHFGLNLDPSHLVWQMIDIERVVRDYGSKIIYVHAKDLEIDRDGLYRHGVMSAGMGWQISRLPGFGEIDWGRFIGALHRAGYEGVISVELGDTAFEATEDLAKRGVLIARDCLRPYVR